MWAWVIASLLCRIFRVDAIDRMLDGRTVRVGLVIAGGRIAGWVRFMGNLTIGEIR